VYIVNDGPDVEVEVPAVQGEWTLLKLRYIYDTLNRITNR